MSQATSNARDPQMKPGLRQGKFLSNTNRFLGDIRDELNRLMYRQSMKTEPVVVTSTELLRCRAQFRTRHIQADHWQGRVTAATLHNQVRITMDQWAGELARNDQAVPETEWVKGSQSIENMWILAAFKIEYLENGMPVQYAIPTLGKGKPLAGQANVPDEAVRGQGGVLQQIVGQQDSGEEAVDAVDSFRISCAFVDIAGSDWGKRHRQARGNELKKTYADSQDQARLLLREQHSTEGGYTLLPSELIRAVKLVENVRRPEKVIGPDQVVSLLGSRYDYATIEKDADRYTAELKQDTSALNPITVQQVTALIECGENDEAISKALTGVPQSLVAKIRADIAKPEAEEPAKRRGKGAKDAQ